MSSTKFRKISVLFLIFSFLSTNVAFALNSSSINYQIQGGQINSLFGTSSSTNYKIEVGGNPISGTASSSNFKVEQGSPLEQTIPASTPAPAISSSAGGGFPTPLASNIQVRNISPTEVEITFETNTRTFARIDYGVFQKFNFQKTEQLDDRASRHRIILTGLSSGTFYNYRIHLWITDNRVNDIGPFFFTTLPIITTTPNVSNLKITPVGEDVLIEWINPLFSSYLETIVVRKIGSFSKDVNDGVLIYSGTGESYTDTSITPNTEYYYTVFVKTTDGKFSYGITQEGDSKKDVFITEPPPLPPDVVPTPETGIGEDVINIFTLLKQGIIPEGEENMITTVRPVTLLSMNGIDWRTLTDSDIFLKIPNSIFLKSVQRVAISILDQVYILKYNEENNSYETLIKSPKEDGIYQAIIQVVYTDNTFEEVNKTVLVDPYGRVYHKKRRSWSWQKPWQILFTDNVVIGKAVVTLETLSETGEWTLWPSDLYDQFNPILTNIRGEFAFVVPHEIYRLNVKKDGFRTHESSQFETESQVVNFDIRLRQKLSTLETIAMFIAVILIIGIFFMRGKR